MTWPPAVLSVRIAGGGRRPIRLWLPLFLLWPLLVLVIVLLPPAVWVCCLAKGWRLPAATILLCGARIVAVLCHTRGLLVRVDDGEDGVYIALK